jgi:hypothetical protein
MAFERSAKFPQSLDRSALPGKSWATPSLRGTLMSGGRGIRQALLTPPCATNEVYQQQPNPSHDFSLCRWSRGGGNADRYTVKYLNRFSSACRRSLLSVHKSQRKLPFALFFFCKVGRKDRLAGGSTLTFPVREANGRIQASRFQVLLCPIRFISASVSPISKL